MWIRRRHLNPAVADLCIVGHNVSLPGHTAVRKIVLNGVEVTGSVIKYADFSHGPSDAILEFFMVKG